MGRAEIVDLLLTNTATTGEPQNPGGLSSNSTYSPVPTRESTAVAASAAVKVYSFPCGGTHARFDFSRCIVRHRIPACFRLIHLLHRQHRLLSAVTVYYFHPR